MVTILVALQPDMEILVTELLPDMVILVEQDMEISVEQDMDMRISRVTKLSDMETLAMEALPPDKALEAMKNLDLTLAPASDLTETSVEAMSQPEVTEISVALLPDITSEATNRSQTTDMVVRIRTADKILVALQLVALTAMLVMAMLDLFHRR